MAKQMNLFGYEDVVAPNEEAKYSRKVSTPIYTPRGGGSSIFACYDHQKYKRLLRFIDNANVNEEEKKFLRLAATRFIEFNYESIADYYACASKDMQGVMEKLALVIIDFDKAIEEGFIQLNDQMKMLYERELEEAQNG